MRLAEASKVKEMYEEFLLNYIREDIEVCHVEDDDAFEFYEISDEEYSQLGIRVEEEGAWA